MRPIQITLLIITCFGCRQSESSDHYKDAGSVWVETTLASMSLAQKAGEMTQLTLGALMVGEDPFELEEPQTFDADKVQDAIVAHHIGSVLN